MNDTKLVRNILRVGYLVGIGGSVAGWIAFGAGMYPGLLSMAVMLAVLTETVVHD